MTGGDAAGLDRGAGDFVLVSINISPAKGTAKKPVPEAVLDRGGLRGDAHSGLPGKGVSLLDIESIESFAMETGLDLRPGDFGENLTTRGLDPGALCPGDRLEVGGILLEVASRGKTCHGDSCAIFRRVGRCIMPTGGVFLNVLRGGPLSAGARGRPVGSAQAAPGDLDG